MVSDFVVHNPGVRLALLTAVVAGALLAPVSLAAPGTSLTVITWLEGGHGKRSYTLTCAPAAVRGLPGGAIKPLAACAALRELGDRLYGESLSRHIAGCNYIQAPRGGLIAGTRNGRRVRVRVDMGACERLLVPAKTLRRIVYWQSSVR
jgi:hypothetical protein